MILTKYRDYRARVHTGPGGDTSTSYITVGAFYQHSAVYNWAYLKMINKTSNNASEVPVDLLCVDVYH